jgi:hypothetical protein
MATAETKSLAPLVVARPNVVFRPDTILIRHNFNDVVVQAPRAPVVMTPPPSTAPVLEPSAQESQLRQVPPPAIDFTTHGGIKYRPLSTWLADPALAIIQCTQDTLRISLNATAPTGVRLVPLVGSLPGAITAQLTNLSSFAALPLDVELDESERRLNLSLKFPDAQAQAL